MQTIKFKNHKIPLITEAQACDLVRVKFVWDACGSVSDDKGGEARFACEVLDEGVDEVFNSELEDRAMALEFDAGFATVSAQLTCLKEFANFGLEKLGELLVKPNLEPKCLERVRLSRCSEIASNELDFNRVSAINLKKLLFNGALARDFNGKSADVKGFDENVVKQLLAKLDLANLYIVVSGDFDESVLSGLTKVLEVLPQGVKRELPNFPTSSEAKTSVLQAQTTQAFITFGAPLSVAFNQRHLALIAFFVLGAGGFGSRLMEEIRVKRGLAYSVYCTAKLTKTNQHFYGALQTKNQSANEACELVKTLVGEFVANGITQDELTKAKQFLLGSQPLRCESCFARAGQKENGFYLSGDEGMEAEILRSLEGATLNEVNEFVASLSEIKRLSFSLVRD